MKECLVALEHHIYLVRGMTIRRQIQSEVSRAAPPLKAMFAYIFFQNYSQFFMFMCKPENNPGSAPYKALVQIQICITYPITCVICDFQQSGLQKPFKNTLKRITL